MLIGPAIFDTEQWRSLNRPARAMLLYLGVRCNGSGQCWPSLARIGEDMGMNRRSVIYAICRLVQTGIVEKKGKPGCKQLYALKLCEPVSQIAPVQKEIPVAEIAPTSIPNCTGPVQPEPYEQIRNKSLTVFTPKLSKTESSGAPVEFWTPEKPWEKNPALAITGTHAEYLTLYKAWLQMATAEFWQAMKSDFPGTEPETEAAESFHWLETNKKRRSNPYRYLRNWLTKAQQRTAWKARKNGS